MSHWPARHPRQIWGSGKEEEVRDGDGSLACLLTEVGAQ